MRELRDHFATIVTDRRVWGVTAFLVGWPALGMFTRASPILETATPVVYVYLTVLNAVVPGFPGDAAFWASLVVFSFSVAVVVVALFDWARTRTVAAVERREDRTVE